MKIVYVGSLPDGSCDWEGVTRNFVKDEPVDWPENLCKDLLLRVDWKPMEDIKAKKGGK